MADQLGSAVLTLSVDDSQFNAGLQRAQSTVQQVGGSLRNALGTLGVATSAAGIAAYVGNQVTQLDAASAAVRTLGVDSQELNAKLRALSVELDNNISTLDLTKAAYDVASSGFSSAADATQILRASALGAKGGFAEVNDVASALTGVLNAYGLSASEATNIVDGFVQTQADGVITVRQYAAEIGNIASIAAASGVGIKELNAAIATATLRGVPVAQTFTGLRQALASIIKPSEQAKDLAQSLGIEFNVSALQAKGLGGVLADVQKKTGGAADKIAILLGSVEAQAAVQPLLNDQLVKYNELLDKQAQSSGAAADSARINAGTISDGLKRIGNGFSNLATTLDKTLSPLFAGFISNINNVLAKLNQVAALSPDKVLAREREATNAVASQLFPGQGSGFFGAVTVKYKGKTYKGSAAGIREAIVQDLLKGELAKINEATSKPAGASSPSKTNGSLDKTAQDLEKVKAAAEAANKAVASLRNIQLDFAVASKAADDNFSNAVAQAEIQNRRINEGFGTAGLGALQSTESINQAKRALELAAVQQSAAEQRAIDAERQALLLRQQGDPRAEEARIAAIAARNNYELAGKAFKTAGAEVSRATFEAKNNLQDAFKSAQDAVKSISRGIEDSVAALQELQNTGGSGLNKFLTPQQVADRQGALGNQLRPEADALANQLGIRFQTRGTREQINQQTLDFIKAARQELRLGQDINQAQQIDLPRATNDLAVLSESLVKVNSQLADATNNLAQKDWAVNVSVNANTGDYAVNLG